MTFGYHLDCCVEWNMRSELERLLEAGAVAVGRSVGLLIDILSSRYRLSPAMLHNDTEREERRPFLPLAMN